MAKDKLFTAKDFDKTTYKSWWQKYRTIILCIVGSSIIAAIVLCCIFCSKNEKKETIEKIQTDQMVESSSLQLTPTEITEGQTDQRIQEFESPQIHQNSFPTTETSKLKVKQKITTKNVAENAIISDNIEQEAMNVIRGIYGNVPERREILGGKYKVIQNKVNQLKKEGIF